ncbi:MAG: sensor histidine kinase [Lachnospiraceae bacterium]|nr:sensor histidine kinase [Lachnospiraceae bacterium]
MICYVINLILWIVHIICNSTILGLGFEPKNKNIMKWKYIAGLILVRIPFSIMKYVFNESDVLRNFSLIMTLVGSFLYLIVLYEGYVWQKLLFLVFEIICTCVGEVIVQLILQDELMQVTDISFNQPIMVLYLIYGGIIISLLYLLFLFVWKQFVAKGSYNLKIFFVFSIFPVSQIIMMASVNVKIYKDMTPAGIINVAGLLISIAADVILLVTLLRQQSMQEMTIRISTMEKAWEMEQNHYRDIEARREELAKIRHDLSEQFMVIQELLHRGNYDKAMEMLDNLREYVAATKEYDYCADPVVNAIMTENEKLCADQDIRFMYELEIGKPLKIEPVAICSIFSNLLRNAIAAAEKTTDKEKAFVSIKAVVKGDYLHIKADNSYTRENKKEKKSRKGYGLEILKTLAEKYNGQMEIVAAGEKYSTRILVENIENTEKGPAR